MSYQGTCNEWQCVADRPDQPRHDNERHAAIRAQILRYAPPSRTWYLGSGGGLPELS